MCFIEVEFNCILDMDKDMYLELIDVIFEEGLDILLEEYDIMVGLFKFLFLILKFIIEKKDFLECVLYLFEYKDIDFIFYNNFLKDYIVKVEDVEVMDKFFMDRFKVLIEISGLYYLESNGEVILIFSNNF